MNPPSIKQTIQEWVVVNELDVAPEDVDQLAEDIANNVLALFKTTL